MHVRRREGAALVAQFGGPTAVVTNKGLTLVWPNVPAKRHLPTQKTKSGSPLYALRSTAPPDFLDGVLASLDASCDRLGLEPTIKTRLRSPERELSFQFRIRMDDGTSRAFDAWRILHSTKRGPGKGGLRVAKGVDKNQVSALAAEMPTKPSIHRLPLGGAKGGIDADPQRLSTAELGRLMRGYVRTAMSTQFDKDGTYAFGPRTDIPAPDVGTSPPDVNLMDLCVDELLAWLVERGLPELDGFVVPACLSSVERTDTTTTPYLDAYLAAFERGAIDNLGLIATFTGKSVGKGGSAGRSEATGLGLAYASIEALQRQGVLPAGAERFSGQTVAVQGFGNVGAGAVQAFTNLGAQVVSIAEYDGESYAVSNPDGFTAEDLEGMAAYKREHGTLRGYPGTTTVDVDEFWALPVDVLAPCARENQITKKNAHRIRAKLVAEGANGPTSHAADDILAARGITVVPDIFANAAGVVVSYFEMKQNMAGETWPLQRVQRELRELVAMGFVALESRGAQTLRQAAFDQALTGLA